VVEFCIIIKPVLEFEFNSISQQVFENKSGNRKWNANAIEASTANEYSSIERVIFWSLTLPVEVVASWVFVHYKKTWLVEQLPHKEIKEFLLWASCIKALLTHKLDCNLWLQIIAIVSMSQLADRVFQKVRSIYFKLAQVIVWWVLTNLDWHVLSLIYY